VFHPGRWRSRNGRETVTRSGTGRTRTERLDDPSPPRRTSRSSAGGWSARDRAAGSPLGRVGSCDELNGKRTTIPAVPSRSDAARLRNSATTMIASDRLYPRLTSRSKAYAMTAGPPAFPIGSTPRPSRKAPRGRRRVRAREAEVHPGELPCEPSRAENKQEPAEQQHRGPGGQQETTHRPYGDIGEPMARRSCSLHCAGCVSRDSNPC